MRRPCSLIDVKLIIVSAARTREIGVLRMLPLAELVRRTEMVGNRDRNSLVATLTRHYLDQCLPAPNYKDISGYLNVNGSVCLNFTC